MSGPDRLGSVAVALWRRHLVAGLALVGALPIAACSQPATTRGAVTESTRVADPDLRKVFASEIVAKVKELGAEATYGNEPWYRPVVQAAAQ